MMWDTFYKMEAEIYLTYMSDGLYEIDENRGLEGRLIKAIKYIKGKTLEINKTLLITHPELCI